MKDVIPLVIAFGIAALVVGVYGVMYSQVARGVARAEAALERTESLAQRDALIRSQQVFLEDVADERATLDEYVANESEVIDVIEIIEDTARAHGTSLAISTVNAVPRTEWQAHEGIEVSFSASGTFRELLQFIGALESLPIASTVDRAALEVSGGSEWFGNFSVTFVKVK